MSNGSAEQASIPPEWRAAAQRLRNAHGVEFSDLAQATATVMNLLSQIRQHHDPECLAMRSMTEGIISCMVRLEQTVVKVKGWNADVWTQEVSALYDLINEIQRREREKLLRLFDPDPEDGDPAHGAEQVH